jgi:hypothetical protein
MMKVITETYLMKVITEVYLMKVIPETYLMKVITERGLAHRSTYLFSYIICRRIIQVTKMPEQ